MSWFLDHREGISQVSSDGFEEEFWHHMSTLNVASMLKAAGSLVIDRTKGRPPKRVPIQPTQSDNTDDVSAQPNKPPGTSTPTKPVVRYVASPHQSARGGSAGIKRIILHYTTAWTMSSTVNWFLDPTSRVSAHYIVGKDGAIVQMVRDSEKAWHAGNENNDSIGIEHVALKGDKLTSEQGIASAKLIRWLKAEYKLTNANVTAHRFTAAGKGTGTDCPGDLWKTKQELEIWLGMNCPDSNSPEIPESSKITESATLRRIVGEEHQGAWAGLKVLNLGIGSYTFRVASGARGAQNFRRPTDPRSVPGNLEPIPQGRYRIGQIEFANGKDNYEGSWGAGLGPVWVGLDAEFSDDRGAFGFHLDQNIGGAPGSAGCVVFRDVADLKRFVAALRKYDCKVLSVDWNLA